MERRSKGIFRSAVYPWEVHSQEFDALTNFRLCLNSFRHDLFLSEVEDKNAIFYFPKFLYMACIYLNFKESIHESLCNYVLEWSLIDEMYPQLIPESLILNIPIIFIDELNRHNVTTQLNIIAVSLVD